MTSIDGSTAQPTRTPPVNFRDLGGIPVDRGTVRTGVVFRSDDVSIVPDDWADAAARELGVTHVIDLRSPHEAAVLGRGALAAHGSIAYHHLPLTDSLPSDDDPAMVALLDHATCDDVGLAYLEMLEKGAGRLVTALSLIATGSGGVVFHCAAGKDRTGVLAAVLLSALGADAPAIIDDYAVTGDNLNAILERVSAAHLLLYGQATRADREWSESVGARFLPGAENARHGRQGVERTGSAMLAAEPAAMAALLDAARRRHGGILEPLRRAGLDMDLVSRLRRRLVQPASEQEAVR